MSRFTIEFSEEVDRQIDQIAKALNANTKADVIRKALGLLTYVVREKAEGSTLIIENKEKNVRKEVVTL
jgi:predicted transcriptional regulator